MKMTPIIMFFLINFNFFAKIIVYFGIGCNFGDIKTQYIMTVIQITIPLIFAVAALAMSFFRRLPACLAAYAAYVSAGLLGAMKAPVEQYLIWGFIAAIDTVNIYATRMTPPRAMQLYAVVGCLVGSVLGAVIGSVAAVMGAGAIGAILGFIAYTRTPEGRKSSEPMSHKLSLFAGSVCTAWFSFVLVAVVLAAIFAK